MITLSKLYEFVLCNKLKKSLESSEFPYLALLVSQQLTEIKMQF